MQSNSTIPVAEIRAKFPALNRKHNNVSIAYFDAPGGTQVPVTVAHAMTDYLFNHNSNAHWTYPTSRETDEIVANSRSAFADFLNAQTDEIVFGQNMTSLTFHLARALGRSFAPGDEIIVTELDHHANIDPWRALERDFGVKIRVAPMNIETFKLETWAIENLLNEKTKLVAVGAASNALGTMPDIKEICRLAKEAGALSFVDAVHYASHNSVDVKNLGCDFLACSAYKFYGPHIGVLYGRKELLETLDFPKLKPAPNTAPERVETGTQSFESIAGAGAAVDFLASLSEGANRREKLENTFAAFETRKKELFKTLWEGLNSIEKVTLYGTSPDSKRTPTVAFTVDGYTSKNVAEKLAESGVFVSNGNFYALTVAEKLGVLNEGLVRAGCACYTTLEEIERLIEGIRILSK
jgi:cysteine desulfurase family protein (TIGR01976 family)